ncbi:hypothetical protein AKAW_10901 [Aspergillus luchuensis IFO 4308]|nr:hypothetical protein AKAW_10901 [Aspergillus luchuensis IFO 4308]
MASKAADWPSQATSVRKAEHPQERALNLQHDANAILRHLDDGRKGSRVPERVMSTTYRIHLYPNISSCLRIQDRELDLNFFDARAVTRPSNHLPSPALHLPFTTAMSSSALHLLPLARF